MSAASPPPLPIPRPAVGPRFIGLYAAANIGAYIAFIPLLTLLLPLKAEAIDPAQRAQLLAQVALWGAATAGVVNVLAGLIGDRIRHWPGGRVPLMIAGLIGTTLSYGLIHLAQTPTALMMAIILLQIGINLMLNPIVAVLPEQVPDRQKGRVAAFTGLALPLSSLFGALVIGIWLREEGPRLAVVAAATVVLVLPFTILTARVPRPVAAIRRSRLNLATLRDRDFQIAFGSRLLVQTMIAINTLYLFYFLQQETRIANVLGGTRPEVVLGGLLAISTVLSVVAGLVGGHLSDRMGFRKRFVLTGSLILAGAAALMALVPGWPMPVVAQALFGTGVGLYSIIDTALVAEVLPNADDTGRDIGIMNVAVTAAQVLAPLLGLMTLRLLGDDLQIVFGLAGVLALTGGVWILTIRRVR